MHPTPPTAEVKPINALIDLAIFLSVMFLVREFSIDSLGFWGNALFRSLTTVGVATLLLYHRKQSWKNVGLTKPGHILKSLGVAGIILMGTVAAVMLFELLVRDLLLTGTESVADSESFSDLKGNLPYFFPSYFLFGLNRFWKNSRIEGFH